MAVTESATGAGNPPASETLAPVSFGQQLAINQFWFANNIHWNALLSVIIPAAVATLLPYQDKGLNVALVVAPGTLIAFFVNPLVGSLSDYARFKMGRRRPFMLIGTAVNIVALLGFGGLCLLADGSLSLTSVLVGMLIFFALIQFSNNFANAPWSAIIADKVPERQRGSASGLYGLMTLLGTAVGVELAAALIPYNAAANQAPPNTSAFRTSLLVMFGILAAIQVIFVALTVLTVKERLPAEPRHFTWSTFLKRFTLEPRKYPDFTWILLTRLLIMTGIWAINFFLLYYFEDVLGISTSKPATAFGITVSSPPQALAVFLPLVLVCSALTVYAAGWLSDRVGRKKLVYLSGAMMTVVALIFIFVQTFPAALVAALFFGLGFGAYTSVDWALATDVLPPTDEAGKNMGIWSAAGIIPQVIGVTLGGVLTFAFHNLPNHLGYTILFGVTVVLFLLGTVLVAQVKGAR